MPMIGDSIVTTIHSTFFSRVDSSNRTESTRHDPSKKKRKKKGEMLSWEFLDDVPLLDKARDRVVTHTHKSYLQ